MNGDYIFIIFFILYWFLPLSSLIFIYLRYILFQSFEDLYFEYNFNIFEFPAFNYA